MVSCIFCEKNDAKVIFTEFGVNFLRCKRCGHLYSSFIRDQHYDGYFEVIEENENDYFYWDLAHRKMYKSFAKKYLKGKSGKLLDVGAGLGFFVKFVSEFGGWKGYGVEISKGGAKFAKKRLNLENFYEGKLEEQNFENESFDIITMWDVLEHIPDPKPILQRIYALLKKGGILFIHTPNGEIQILKAKFKKAFFKEKEGMHFLEAKDHLNLYSPKTIEKILNLSGFKEVKFTHLPPIQAVAGKRAKILILIKNLYYLFSLFLYFITFKMVNTDNLFLEAKKN